MTTALDPENPALKKGMYRLYRDFFTRAEKKRRWSIDTDIPWEQVNRSLPPELADVVETFCAVEMYLPDFVSKALPMIRKNRGWAWFHVNWGYEESKHSLVLFDWLLRSGQRTEEQMSDMEDMVFDQEWDPPMDSGAGMLVYAMTQELATWLHYKRLQAHVERYGDGALEKILQLVSIDERSHHAFYRQAVELFLTIDREETLEQLHRVLHHFSMPAVHLLAESQEREQAIRNLEIFNEDIFFIEVYQPLLEQLGVSRKELRRKVVAPPAESPANAGASKSRS